MIYVYMCSEGKRQRQTEEITMEKYLLFLIKYAISPRIRKLNATEICFHGITTNYFHLSIVSLNLPLHMSSKPVLPLD